MNVQLRERVLRHILGSLDVARTRYAVRMSDRNSVGTRLVYSSVPTAAAGLRSHGGCRGEQRPPAPPPLFLPSSPPSSDAANSSHSPGTPRSPTAPSGWKSRSVPVASSRTVRVTTISPGPASPSARDAMWTPMPPTSSSRTSTSPGVDRRPDPRGPALGARRSGRARTAAPGSANRTSRGRRRPSTSRSDRGTAPPPRATRCRADRGRGATRGRRARRPSPWSRRCR